MTAVQAPEDVLVAPAPDADRDRAQDAELDALVQAARAGSDPGAGPAFSTLWGLLSPVVAGYLAGRGVHDVDDVTSEVFLAAFRSIGQFSGDGDGFRRWLFTIAHHRAVDAIRQQVRHPQEELEEARFTDQVSGCPAASAEDRAMDRIDAEEALRLVQELPDDQRDVLLLRVAADLPADEVGEVLGRSPEAVRQLQHRAIVRLRELTVQSLAEV
ncbi:RNA polymerase sigma factor [Spongisporangium articulatum]|uniref:RNA polymerase sigma factor n=1 Tax=Spongisporangium articulatum TaxID=3362603 RepID=A0ABW8AK45_9ACTN